MEEKWFLVVMQTPLSGMGWLGCRPLSPTCLCSDFSGSKTDVTSKGPFTHQYLQLWMQWGLFLFFPHGSGPHCLWCIPKSPGDHFPLPPTSFKKKESSFLCCRNDKGSSSHLCPWPHIVKTDLVLSPSHRCGWLFSREVRQGELNKLIWLPLVQTFLVRTYWGKISIKRAKAGKGHLAYLVHFLKSKQTFEKIHITPYPFTLFPCTEDGRV